MRRRLGLVQAISVNMAMMVGMGPFVTIPLLVATMGGPQAMLGWVLGAVLAVCDGLVWCELAAAFPGSGGTYHFYEAVYGNARAGRLLKFLFVWQFLFSGPLEIATGAVGLGRYAGFLWPILQTPAWNWPGTRAGVAWEQVMAVGLVAAIVGLAYRRIEAAGRLMVVLWAGMLLTVGWVVMAGLVHFDPALAFDFPPDAWRLDRRFALGLGAALQIAMYNYLGYYQVCYLGDEVTDPARTLPRSILVAVGAVAGLNLAMTLGILGSISWHVVARSPHVASDLISQVQGPVAATILTVMILWTGTASVFSALLGYSRVPYAAAKAGHFFRGLAATHPSGAFPHRALLLIGALTALACLADLEAVIAALLTSRILIQFVGQIATVFYLRRQPNWVERMPFRMWLYPLPALLALVGWLGVFAASTPVALGYGLLSLAAGGAGFAVWDRMTHSRKPGPGDPRPDLA